MTSIQRSFRTNLRLFEGAINNFSIKHQSVDPAGRPIKQLKGYPWGKLRVSKFKAYWKWYHVGSEIDPKLKITKSSTFRYDYYIHIEIDGSQQHYHYRPLPWTRPHEGVTIKPKGTIWVDWSIPIVKLVTAKDATIVPRSPKRGHFPMPEIDYPEDTVYKDGVPGHYNSKGVWVPFKPVTMRATRINLGNNIWTAKPVNIGKHTDEYEMEYKKMIYDNLNYFIYRSILPDQLIKNMDEKVEFDTK